MVVERQRRREKLPHWAGQRETDSEQRERGGGRLVWRCRAAGSAGEDATLRNEPLLRLEKNYGLMPVVSPVEEGKETDSFKMAVLVRFEWFVIGFESCSWFG
jgi:hypothetical protein